MNALDTSRSESAGGCPVCGWQRVTSIRPAFDDRYGQPDHFTLVRCDQCGHCMTSPRLGESDLGRLYSTYYPRKHVNVEDLRREAKRSVTRFAPLRRWWLGTDNQGQYAVRPGEVMLDIGCGSGLSLLEATAMGAQVRGVEADPNVRRIADELGMQIHIGSLLDEPFTGERFDLVVLNQVIEHVPDPGLALERLRSRLRPGGRVVLVFPNIQSVWCRISGARWINWHVPYHLHHFSLGTFSRLANRYGYRVRSVRTITPNLWTLLQFRANRLTVERGMPSPMWAVAAQPAAPQGATPAVPSRLSVRRVLRRVVLGGLLLSLAVINRIIDAVGLGDSLMVEIVPMEHP
jgi:2-polyprenyl-3-methyl-5-hydroxy-6-metoxy-1,4-benzoquinol methylase